MNKLLQLIVIFTLTLIFSKSFAETYEIAAAFGLSGDSVVHGQTDLNATKLAIQDFEAANPGSAVKLTVEDTTTSDKGALTAVQRLASLNKAQIILGPTWLDSFQAPIFLAKQRKLFLFSPSAASAAFKKAKGDYPYIFSTWIPLEQSVNATYKLFQRDRRLNIILVTDEDPFILKLRELFVAQKPTDINIVENYALPVGTDDFASLVARLNTKKVDAIFLNLGSTKGFLSFLKQRKQLKLTIPVYTQEYGEAMNAMPEFKGLLEDIVYTLPETSDETLIRRYRDTFSSAPEVNVGYAYDAASMLLSAYKEGANTPEKLFKFLTTREFSSKAYGTIKFNADGDIVTIVKFSKKHIQNGKIVEDGIL